MVLRIILTQPLAAGPEGDWECDLLMEAIPVIPPPPSPPRCSATREAVARDLHRSVRPGLAGAAPAGAAPAVASHEAITAAEMSVSDDDELEVSRPESLVARESDTMAMGTHEGQRRHAHNKATETATRGDVTHGSSEADDETRIPPGDRGASDDSAPPAAGAGASVCSRERDTEVSGPKAHSVAGNTGGEAGFAKKRRSDDVRGCDDVSDVHAQWITVASPVPNSPSMIENTSSPTTGELDIASDSTYSSSEAFSSSGEESEERDDDDDFVPDAAFPPCYLTHKGRKTHKDSLCKECYDAYVSKGVVNKFPIVVLMLACTRVCAVGVRATEATGIGHVYNRYGCNKSKIYEDMYRYLFY